jgi:hypothetical protein
MFLSGLLRTRGVLCPGLSLAILAGDLRIAQSMRSAKKIALQHEIFMGINRWKRGGNLWG